ncbi:MAG: hypothetical protein R2821_12850 [Flavobacteriaceae bacterium]|jgi:histidinol phosphatase-like PHP family hydrolase|nr:hypothetical protein [Flavobacteriaceae bacterium]
MKEKEATYVLFGEKAVNLYKISFKLLMNSTDEFDFKVGAYHEVKDFVEETKKWEGFIEITYEEYEQLLEKAVRLPEEKTSKKAKKGFFSNFFK